jgi:hypothetical protein
MILLQEIETRAAAGWLREERGGGRRRGRRRKGSENDRQKQQIGRAKLFASKSLVSFADGMTQCTNYDIPFYCQQR